MRMKMHTILSHLLSLETSLFISLIGNGETLMEILRMNSLLDQKR